MADFKEVEVRSFYKNDGRDKSDKSSYQPISFLFNVPKIYERCLCNQLHDCFDKIIFSKYQCRFCKGSGTQYALLVLIKKIKTALNNKEFCVTILTDLSKVFDCICYNLLIAKLNAYGFHRIAL